MFRRENLETGKKTLEKNEKKKNQKNKGETAL